MKVFDRLINSFRKFPSVGPKQAERFSMYVMRASNSDINELIEAILELKNNLKECRQCFNYSLNELCEICSDERRDRTKICVVENPFDINAIEKTKIYNSLYFVLGGYIIPHQEDRNFKIRIDRLISFIEMFKVQEIIIALNTTTEGQATTLFLKETLKGLVPKITRIAFGVPLGADIDYIDEFTLTHALKDRTEIK